MEDIKPNLGEPVHQTEESKAGHQWISVAAYYKAATDCGLLSELASAPSDTAKN